MTLPSHGSNPHYIYESLKLAQPDRSIDFSANLNPLGPPAALKNKWMEAFELITTYPDPNATAFTSKLASLNHVQENELLIGNGGAELITLIVVISQENASASYSPLFLNTRKRAEALAVTSRITR